MSADPVELWRRTADDVKTAFVSPSSPRLLLNSSVMTSFSGDTQHMKRLIKEWPIAAERRAITWTPHLGLLASATTGMEIGIRVNSYCFLSNPNYNYYESAVKLPRLTWVISLYASGLFFLAVSNHAVSKFLYTQGVVCDKCLFAGHIVSSLAGGVLLPMLSAPYLSAAAAVFQGDSAMMPQQLKSRNWRTYVFRYRDGLAACKGVLTRLVAFQCVIAATCVYVRLWGRQRILDTVTVEPNFVEEINGS